MNNLTKWTDANLKENLKDPKCAFTYIVESMQDFEEDGNIMELMDDLQYVVAQQELLPGYECPYPHRSPNMDTTQTS